MGAPDALNRTDADPGRLRHQDAGPIVVSPGCSPSVDATTRSAVSALSGLMREGRSCRAAVRRSFLDKALLPAPNAGLRLGRAPHSRIRTDATGGQIRFSPPDVLLRRVAVLNQGFEPTNMADRRRAIFQRASRKFHGEPASGILSGTQMLGSIH